MITIIKSLKINEKNSEEKVTSCDDYFFTARQKTPWIKCNGKRINLWHKIFDFYEESERIYEKKCE